MTNREAYNVVISGVITEELIAWAQENLDKMNAANEKRRNTVSKAEIANAPIREQIVSEILGTELKTASMIAAEMGGEITHNKVTAVLKKAVEDGTVVKEDVKVAGKGTQKGYRLAE